MARAPIVDPDRRAIGAEQPVGAVAEDVEARPTGSASPRGCAENSSSSARTSRCSSSRLAQAEQLERRHERVGRLRRVAVDVDGRRRRVEADRQQADALAAADERQQQRRAACRAAPRDPASAASASATSVGVARAKASATSAASSAPGIHGSVAQRVEAEARGGLQRAVARVVLEQQRADAAGDVERVLVQVRQQVGRASCRAPAATPAAAGAVPCRAATPVAAVSRRGVESRAFAWRRGDCGDCTAIDRRPPIYRRRRAGPAELVTPMQSVG